MRCNRRHFLGTLASIPAAMSTMKISWAAESANGYPSHPIKLVVPFGPGSSTDIAARSLADVAGAAMNGANFVVENRPGAGGGIGAGVVARSPADGYTLMYSAATPYAIAPYVYPDLAFDPIKDFMPIIVTISVPVFLVVAGDSDIHSVADLMSALKADPDKHNFASNGVGTSSHIICTLLSLKAGPSGVLHVPYKQGSQAVMADIIGKRITFGVDPWSVVGPMVQSGRLRALAVTSKERLSVAPQIPTLAETLGDEFVIVTWNGLWAPTGTAPSIVNQLHQAFSATWENKKLVDLFESQGTPLMPLMSVEESTKFMLQENQRWKSFVEQAGIRA